MARRTDFLDEVISEREASSLGFKLMVEAALERRRLLRRLAEHRLELGLSQTAVAAKMGTSQSAVARIESGDADVKMSTVERYAATLGRKVGWRLASRSGSGSPRVAASATVGSSSRSSKKAVTRRSR